MDDRNCEICFGWGSWPNAGSLHIKSVLNGLFKTELWEVLACGTEGSRRIKLSCATAHISGKYPLSVPCVAYIYICSIGIIGCDSVWSPAELAGDVERRVIWNSVVCVVEAEGAV